MTKEELKKKWLVILFFSSVILIFAYFIYFLATGTYDPAAMRWVSRTEVLHTSPPGAGNFLLQKNQDVIAGNLRISYLGIKAKSLMIDLVIMDLDPSYAYRHRVPLDRAKQGFSLSGVRFRASSITEDSVRLERRP